MEGIDDKDRDLETSDEFGRMIEEGRREATIPWGRVKAELLGDE